MRSDIRLLAFQRLVEGTPVVYTLMAGYGAAFFPDYSFPT